MREGVGGAYDRRYDANRPEENTKPIRNSSLFVWGPTDLVGTFSTSVGSPRFKARMPWIRYDFTIGFNPTSHAHGRFETSISLRKGPRLGRSSFTQRRIGEGLVRESESNEFNGSEGNTVLV